MGSIFRRLSIYRVAFELQPLQLGERRSLLLGRCVRRHDLSLSGRTTFVEMGKFPLIHRVRRCVLPSFDVFPRSGGRRQAKAQDTPHRQTGDLLFCCVEILLPPSLSSGLNSRPPAAAAAPLPLSFFLPSRPIPIGLLGSATSPVPSMLHPPTRGRPVLFCGPAVISLSACERGKPRLAWHGGFLDRRRQRATRRCQAAISGRSPPFQNVEKQKGSPRKQVPPLPQCMCMRPSEGRPTRQGHHAGPHRSGDVVNQSSRQTGEKE